MSERLNLDSPVYRERVRIPKWNVKVGPLMDADVGGRLLRQRLPDFSKSDHESAARYFTNEAERSKGAWGALIDREHRRVFGKEWSPIDYKISGIGRDEYGETAKEKLRGLAIYSGEAAAAAAAHWRAAGHRNVRNLAARLEITRAVQNPLTKKGRAFQSGRRLRVKKSSASEAYRTRLAVDPRRARRVLRRSGYRVNPGRPHSQRAELDTAIAMLKNRGWTQHDVNRAFNGLRLDEALELAERELSKLRTLGRVRRNPVRREIVTITGKRTGRIYAYMKPDATRAEIGRAALMLANEHSEPVKVERVQVRTRSLPAMPEKVRAYLSNPAPRPEVAAAARRFQRFTGHRADRVQIVPFPANPGAGLAVGPVLMLGYLATRDGKTENYLHKFRGKSRPTLVASHDGKQLILVGGRFRFTERGIVDK